jgi:quercetin dioxygenase-like cupin family protein
MSALRVISSVNRSWIGKYPLRKTLFVNADIGLRIDIERHASGNGIRIEPADAWVEAVVLPLESTEREHGASYIRIEPGNAWAGDIGYSFDLLRCSYSGSFLERGGFLKETLERCGTLSKTCITLAWKDAPPRLPDNAIARTAGLFRTPSAEFISTMLDAQAGWELEEHSHSTDVASICIAGGGTLTSGVDLYPREPIQVALIPAGTSHAFVAGPRGVTLFIIVFPAGTL